MNLHDSIRDKDDELTRLRVQLSAALAKVAELNIVALEAAAMLSETNHGGLSHARSVSMEMALRAVPVPIPSECSACPHPARELLTAKVAELTTERDDYRDGARAEARRCDELLAERNRARNETLAALEENARLRREMEELTRPATDAEVASWILAAPEIATVIPNPMRSCSNCDACLFPDQYTCHRCAMGNPAEKEGKDG